MFVCYYYLHATVFTVVHKHLINIKCLRTTVKTESCKLDATLTWRQNFGGNDATNEEKFLVQFYFTQ